MLLQFLSGYAILHPRIFGGFLAKPTAFRLHAMIQPITAAAFVLHGVPFLRGVLRKRGLSGLAVDIPLFLAGVGFLASVVYLRVLG